MCRTHSEAKQTEMSEFGAEEGLLQGHAKRQGGSCPEKPPAPQRVLAKHSLFFNILIGVELLYNGVLVSAV